MLLLLRRLLLLLHVLGVGDSVRDLDVPGPSVMFHRQLGPVREEVSAKGRARTDRWSLESVRSCAPSLPDSKATPALWAEVVLPGRVERWSQVESRQEGAEERRKEVLHTGLLRKQGSSEGSQHHLPTHASARSTSPQGQWLRRC